VSSIVNSDDRNGDDKPEECTAVNAVTSCSWRRDKIYEMFYTCVTRIDWSFVPMKEHGKTELTQHW